MAGGGAAQPTGGAGAVASGGTAAADSEAAADAKAVAAGSGGATDAGGAAGANSVSAGAGGPDSNDFLILVGRHNAVLAAQRLIAMIDLPVPGVRLDMWGFQISSRDPKQMKSATTAVYRRIDGAKLAVRELAQDMQFYAAKDLQPDPAFKSLLTESAPDGLGYTNALDPYRTQSLTDVLLRLVAATPEEDARFANDLYNKLGYNIAAGDMEMYEKPGVKLPPGVADTFRYRYKDILNNAAIVPFNHLFIPRGLSHSVGDLKNQWSAEASTTDGKLASMSQTDLYNLQARRSILDFTYSYADSIENPGTFSAYYLEQTAGVLTDRLQLAADALNADVEELIIQSTLDKISADLAAMPGIEFAQVGRVEVATLNNVPTTVTGTAVHTFDSLPPLTLANIAKGVSASTPPAFLATEALQLIAAAGQNVTVWNELDDGISLEVTPNVLRNAASAELLVHLTVNDSQAKPADAGAPPLSYISKHEVRDRVDVNALDIFDLSTFSSQATVNGGRAYAPIIGPAWHGVFGDVPVLGSLFSWKRNPKTVYSQSVLFASTLITPTAMELALLYPIKANDNQATPEKTSTAPTGWKDDTVRKGLIDKIGGYRLSGLSAPQSGGDHP